MKYFRNEKEVTEEQFKSYLYDDMQDDEDLQDNYDDLLDDEDIEIGDLTFTKSEILKNCDSIAYRCGLSDYASAEYENIIYDLDIGTELSYNGNDYEIRDEDDEDE